MTQIINLITFIMELVFHRGKNTEKKDSKSSLMQTALIAILAVSLYGNYLLTGRVYDKTKQVVSLKTELQELRLEAERVPELKYTVLALNHTVALLTGKVKTQCKNAPFPPLPPRKPHHPNHEKAVVPGTPTKPARRPPVKETIVE